MPAVLAATDTGGLLVGVGQALIGLAAVIGAIRAHQAAREAKVAKDTAVKLDTKVNGIGETATSVAAALTAQSAALIEQTRILIAIVGNKDKS